MQTHKRQLTGAEIEHIRETLRACSSEFDELFRTKEWFVTSVADQIESSLEILDSIQGSTNVETEGLVLGSGDVESERQRGVHNRGVRSRRGKAE